MAIINPTYDDFKNNQERALDFKEYRSSWNIIKASSYYFKIATRAEDLENLTNAIGTGLEIDAWHQDDGGTENLHILITKGTCIKDNQVIIFHDDFEFIYDIPAQASTYNIYIRYKYVDEYPPNVATIDIIVGDNPTVTDEFLLLAKVIVDPANVVVGDNLSGITIDTSPRDAMVVDVHTFNANNILGGDQNTIVYQTNTDHTGFIIAPNIAGQYLSWDGTAFVWSIVDNVEHASCAQIANIIAGGNVNEILVQTAADTTGFISAPSNNDQFLFWNGSTFVWRDLTNIPYADSADIANRIANGNTNEILVQTGASQTGFISAPSTTSYLYFDGTSFIWKTDIDGAQYVCGGSANEILVQTGVDQTGFISAPSVANAYLKWDGSAFVWDNSAIANYATCASTIVGGVANQILYQTTADTTGFIPAPSVANVFLSWDGSQFTWSPTTVAEANHAICADYTTNMSGGAANQILYQTNADNTAFISAPTGDNQYLAYDSAAGGFIWRTLDVDNAQVAQCAINLANGAAYEIPYQTGANTTSFISAPTTNNQYLKWDGSTFVWDELATGTVDVAQCAYNLVGGSADQIPVQSGANSTTFISAPAVSNTYLQWDGNNFIWDAVNNTETANNIAGGNTNEIPFQTGANQTDFIAAPPSGEERYLKYDGSSFNWATLSDITVGYAENLKFTGSVFRQLVVQEDENTTTLVEKPTSAGQYLGWDGVKYTWVTPSGGSSDVAQCACNLVGSTYPAVVIQTGNNTTDFSEAASSTDCLRTQFLFYDASSDSWRVTKSNGQNGNSVQICDTNTDNYRTLRVDSSGNRGRFAGLDWQTAENCSITAAIHGHTPNNATAILGTSCGYGLYGAGGVGGVYGASVNCWGVMANSCYGTGILGYSACGKAACFGTSADGQTAINVYTLGNSLALDIDAKYDAVNVYSCYAAGIKVCAPSPTSGYGVLSNAGFYTFYGISGCLYNEGPIISDTCITMCSSYKCPLCVISTCCVSIKGQSPYVGVGGCSTGDVGVYGYAEGCYAISGYAVIDYAVVGNTDYANLSDSDIKYLCDICVQECIRANPIKVYKYTYTDENLKSFVEFIGPTAQDIEEVFELNHDNIYEKILEFEEVYPEISKPKQPEKPKNYLVTWRDNIKKFSLQEIKLFEKYEQELEKYRDELAEYEAKKEEYYKNPIVKYYNLRNTVDGIAFALANENFQCILGHNEEIAQLKERVQELEEIVAQLTSSNNNT